MDLSINFANPVGCYDNLLNKCAGRLCHVEACVTIDMQVLRVLIDNELNDSYSPDICQVILNNTQHMTGEVVVAFYILFGGIFSMRLLTDDNEDEFHKIPKKPIYESLVITLDEDKFHDMIKWNVRMLGRSYDIPRAVLLLTPFSFPHVDRPESFFCSQLIMYMIKDCEILTVEQDIDIDHMKPDHVYEWLLQKVQSIKEEND